MTSRGTATSGGSLEAAFARVPYCVDSLFLYVCQLRPPPRKTGGGGGGIAAVHLVCEDVCGFWALVAVYTDGNLVECFDDGTEVGCKGRLVAVGCEGQE